MEVSVEGKGTGRIGKMEKSAMMQVSQPQLTLQRALRLKGSITAVLHWVEIARPFCLRLDQSLDIGGSWKNISSGEVLCRSGNP